MSAIFILEIYRHGQNTISIIESIIEQLNQFEYVFEPVFTSEPSIFLGDFPSLSIGYMVRNVHGYFTRWLNRFKFELEVLESLERPSL